MASNPVVYVIQPPQVSRCQGCKTPIQKMKAPNNIVFRFKMFRPRPADPSNTQGEWVTLNNRSNGYFHARDLGCLHNWDELIDVQYEDLYMQNNTNTNTNTWPYTTAPETRPVATHKECSCCCMQIV